MPAFAKKFKTFRVNVDLQHASINHNLADIVTRFSDWPPVFLLGRQGAYLFRLRLRTSGNEVLWYAVFKSDCETIINCCHINRGDGLAEDGLYSFTACTSRTFRRMSFIKTAFELLTSIAEWTYDAFYLSKEQSVCLLAKFAEESPLELPIASKPSSNNYLTDYVYLKDDDL